MIKINVIILAITSLLFLECSGGGSSKKKDCGQKCTVTSMVLYSSLESSRKSSCEANRSITGESIYQTCVSSASITATRDSATYRTDCQKKCDGK